MSDASDREPAADTGGRSYDVRGRSYGAIAELYDRGRPGYPEKAAVWLTSDQAVSVLELGAGTGKLTRQLVALGHGVHATDPDPAMLDILARNVPHALAKPGSAEKIEAPDNSFDVVVCGQSFHWFEHEAAIKEIVRVLKPGGRLSMVWNERDVQIPWVKKLSRIIGGQAGGVDPTDVLDKSLKFIMIEEERFPHWHTITRETIRDLVTSHSHIATLGEAERQAKIDEVVEFYDGYGRGMDGMQMPFVARCFRARVVKRREPDPPPRPTPPADPAEGVTDPYMRPVTDAPGSPSASPPDDDAIPLIDFH